MHAAFAVATDVTDACKLSVRTLPMWLNLSEPDVPDACKIETVGGQFVVAAGVPSPSKNHAGSMALLATRIRSALESSRWSTGEDVKVRIGIHSGTVGKKALHAEQRIVCRVRA